MSRKTTACFAIAVLVCGASAASAQTAPALGAAQPYAVLGASTVTSTGATVISGNLGVNPGSSIVGFPPGVVVGTIHAADANALAAQTSATAAYVDLESQPCTVDLTGQDLGGLTLTAGVYCFAASAQLTGTLTLDAQGNAAAVFVFKVGSTLTTASGSSVVMINGGSLCNLFWQVGSSATLGTTTSFAGTIVALTSITLNTGASVNGRLLARNGAVTLDSNSVIVSCPSGQPPPNCPAIGIDPQPLPNGTVGIAYSQQLTGSGGTAPYSFDVTAGALPAGLSLSFGGLVSGTPTSAGPSNFTIRGTDALGCSAVAVYAMSITTAVPTLPQVFAVLLALTLAALGYMRLNRPAGTA